jgi:hypothetical protein
MENINSPMNVSIHFILLCIEKKRSILILRVWIIFLRCDQMIENEDWKDNSVLRHFLFILHPQNTILNDWQRIKVSSSFFSRSFYFILSPLYFSHSVLFTLYFPLVFRLGLSFFSLSNGEINTHTQIHKKSFSSSSSFSFVCVRLCHERRWQQYK